jgi:hypothetical protein
MSYAHQKLKNAVEALQADPVNKRRWLEGNDVHHVLHLAPEDFPHDVREDFNRLRSDWLVERMRKSFSAQIDIARAMTDVDAERLTAQITELYYHVDAAMFSRAHQPRRPLVQNILPDAPSQDSPLN